MFCGLERGPALRQPSRHVTVRDWRFRRDDRAVAFHQRQAQDFRAYREQAAGARQPLPVVAGALRGLAHPLLGGAQLEAQALLDPQRILDQVVVRRLAGVVVDQPEQRHHREQEHPDRNPG
ncbi:MAG: hypothetical protein HC861_01260 [Rhodospirillaceae bacterium]|nr:hypothetical protein [Rhodospirillaceae bacterium]